MKSYSAASNQSVLESPNNANALLSGDSPAGAGLLLQEKEVTAAIAAEPATPAPSETWKSSKLFVSTFVTIFLAELGDKTQVSTLLMSAEFHAPWVVFAGAAIALITTSFLGVWVGCWLSSRLSPRTLDKSAGVTLALLSLWLLWDVVQL